MKFVQVERSCAEDELGVLEAVPPPQIRPLSPITKGKEGGQEAEIAWKTWKRKFKKICKIVLSVDQGSELQKVSKKS